MQDVIRLLIADDSAATRQSLRRLLEFEKDIVVVGEAENGEAAIKQARALQPDAVLMDVNMDPVDGITATQEILTLVPRCVIVMMSVQGEQEYLRRAMAAGARDYLIKPFSADELVHTLRNAYVMESKRWQQVGSVPAMSLPSKHGKVVSVFSAKGGVGKTTIATNLAASLSRDWQKSVVLVDLDLQFGDVPVLLDLEPRRTIVDLAQGKERGREEIDNCLIRYSSQLRVLAPPSRPEEAELVSAQHVKEILDILRSMADYIIVDTAQNFQDQILTALDESDLILVIATLDIPTVKNVHLCLEVMRQGLEYPAEKTKLIVNRAAEDIGIKCEVLEKKLGIPIAARIPSDGRLAIKAVNEGFPFVLSNPGAAISQGIRDVAEIVAGPLPAGERRKAKGWRLLGRWLKSEAKA